MDANETLYGDVVQLTYEALTNEGQFEPEPRYVQYKIEQQRNTFRGMSASTLMRFLEASNSGSVDDVSDYTNDRRSFADAIRVCLYDAFTDDVYKTLIENGFPSCIPDFESYEAMVAAKVSFARSIQGDTDDVRGTVKGDILDGYIGFADDDELRWLADHVDRDVDMEWVGTEARIIDGKSRKELHELADAMADDVMDRLD